MWTLSNFQHSRADPGKRMVRLNFDETCISFHQNEKSGFLVAQARKRNRAADPLVRNVSTGAQRTNMTHLAVISDDPYVQERVPQMLIVGEGVMPLRVLRTVQECVSPPWTLLRQAKGWVNVSAMMAMARVLVNALKELRDDVHFVVSFDTYRAHLNPQVLRFLSMNGLHVVIVPSLMTWALQPLDTHAFGCYKRELSVNAQTQLLLNPDCPSTWSSLIRLVVRTGDAVIRNRSWEKSFQDLGLVGCQTMLSSKTKTRVGFEMGVPYIGSDLPSLSQLQELFPRGADIPVEALLMTAKELPKTEAAKHTKVSRPGALSISAHEPAGVSSAKPWFGRTRSTSGLSLPDTSGSASSSRDPWIPSCVTRSAPPRPAWTPPFLPNAKKLPGPRKRNE